MEQNFTKTANDFMKIKKNIIFMSQNLISKECAGKKWIGSLTEKFLLVHGIEGQMVVKWAPDV